jgi:hypothetical protein
MRFFRTDISPEDPEQSGGGLNLEKRRTVPVSHNMQLTEKHIKIATSFNRGSAKVAATSEGQ